MCNPVNDQRPIINDQQPTTLLFFFFFSSSYSHCDSFHFISSSCCDCPEGFCSRHDCHRPCERHHARLSHVHLLRPDCPPCLLQPRCPPCWSRPSGTEGPDARDCLHRGMFSACQQRDGYLCEGDLHHACSPGFSPGNHGCGALLYLRPCDRAQRYSRRGALHAHA